METEYVAAASTPLGKLPVLLAVFSAAGVFGLVEIVKIAQASNGPRTTGWILGSVLWATCIGIATLAWKAPPRSKEKGWGPISIVLALLLLMCFVPMIADLPRSTLNHFHWSKTLRLIGGFAISGQCFLMVQMIAVNNLRKTRTN